MEVDERSPAPVRNGTDPSYPHTRGRTTARRASAQNTSHGSAPPINPFMISRDESAQQRSSHGRPSGPLLSSRTGPRNASERAKVQKARTALSVQDLPFGMHRFNAQFPVFKGCARFNGFNKQSEPQQFFDCKFYPYTQPGVDPVVAIVGGTQVIVARPSVVGDRTIEIISWLNEDVAAPLEGVPPTDEPQSDASKKASKRVAFKSGPQIRKKPLEHADLNSCVWMREPDTEAPLLAIAGKPSTIKVIDVTRQELHRTLIGHGKEVNDLAVSPRDPSILASASGDHTVRIWSLDERYSKQPCMLLCAGEGHKQGLLTLAFHEKGRYLLTGGVDCAVCLWVLPDLPNEASGTDKPTTLTYPHFKSTAIHESFVDCVAFYYDLILSKCARENKIVLWRIEGFDSRKEPPMKPPTTADDRPTRSAFGGKFQRLIQFDVADTTSFYIRFSLFRFPGQRDILAIGNERSRVCFWDLTALREFGALDEYADGPDQAGTAASASGAAGSLRGRGGKSRKRAGKQRAAAAFGQQLRDQSVISEASNGRPDSLHSSSIAGGALDGSGPTTAAGGPPPPMANFFVGSKATLARRYRMDDPFKTLEPHKVSIVQRVNFACRQVAWSVGGEWMVVVGDQGMVGLFGRDLAKDEP